MIPSPRVGKIAGLFVILVLALSSMGAACESAADTASDNLSKEAENFEVMRSIVGINGFTDKTLFEVIGRCSIEGGDGTATGMVEIICREAPGDDVKSFKKHHINTPDNLIIISTQLEAKAVSTTRSKVIFKPEGLIPDIDLVTSQDK